VGSRSKLLFAMGQAGVRCAELEEAAGAERSLAFTFADPVGAVSLRQKVGGTQQQVHNRAKNVI
jgi:hypothetical protein